MLAIHAKNAEIRYEAIAGAGDRCTCDAIRYGLLRSATHAFRDESEGTQQTRDTCCDLLKLRTVGTNEKREEECTQPDNQGVFVLCISVRLQR